MSDRAIRLLVFTLFVGSVMALNIWFEVGAWRSFFAGFLAGLLAAEVANWTINRRNRLQWRWWE